MSRSRHFLPQMAVASPSVTYGEDWETYPTQRDKNVPLGCDTTLVRRRLNEDEQRLFSANGEMIDLWCLAEESGRPSMVPKSRLLPFHSIPSLLLLFLSLSTSPCISTYLLLGLQKHVVHDVQELTQVLQVSRYFPCPPCSPLLAYLINLNTAFIA